MEMGREKLEESLALLGDLLASYKKSHIHIIVSRGAALLAGGFIERATNDIDILAERTENGIDSVNGLPAYFRTAATEVATEMNLSNNWINSSLSIMMSDLPSLPQSIWQEMTTKEYGEALTVSFIGREGQLYLKLWAALDRNEPRDISDLKELAITKAEAQEVLTWLKRESLIQNIPQTKISATMKELFDE